MTEIFSFFKDWSGLVGMGIASILWFSRNENRTEDNEKSIARLEDTINKLVEKIDKLLDGQSDNRALFANHEARINNLEKITSK